MPETSGFTNIQHLELPIIPIFGGVNQASILHLPDQHWIYRQYLIARLLWFCYDKLNWGPVWGVNYYHAEWVTLPLVDTTATRREQKNIFYNVRDLTVESFLLG